MGGKPCRGVVGNGKTTKNGRTETGISIKTRKEQGLSGGGSKYLLLMLERRRKQANPPARARGYWEGKKKKSSELRRTPGKDGQGTIRTPIRDYAKDGYATLEYTPQGEAMQQGESQSYSNREEETAWGKGKKSRDQKKHGALASGR